MLNRYSWQRINEEKKNTIQLKREKNILKTYQEQQRSYSNIVSLLFLFFVPFTWPISVIYKYHTTITTFCCIELYDLVLKNVMRKRKNNKTHTKLNTIKNIETVLVLQNWKIAEEVTKRPRWEPYENNVAHTLREHELENEKIHVYRYQIDFTSGTSNRSIEKYRRHKVPNIFIESYILNWRNGIIEIQTKV